jgi:hypothetical protein
LTVPLKKVSSKLKTKKQQIPVVLKTDIGSSPNSSPKNVLSIRNTSSPSQSHETVPLRLARRTESRLVFQGKKAKSKNAGHAAWTFDKHGGVKPLKNHQY